MMINWNIVKRGEYKIFINLYLGFLVGGFWVFLFMKYIFFFFLRLSGFVGLKINFWCCKVKVYIFLNVVK